MSQGEQEVVALFERLGFTPLKADDTPGIEHLRALGASLIRVRPTPAFQQLIARRERDEIDGEEFVAAVESLIAALPPESTSS